MPTAASRPCRHPRCPALTTDGWCPSHRVTHQREADRRKGTPASRGYDHRWRKVREQALRRDRYLCVECLRHGRPTTALDVDHIVPFSSIDDPLRLDVSNLQSLCRPCHNAKTHGSHLSDSNQA